MKKINNISKFSILYLQNIWGHLYKCSGNKPPKANRQVLLLPHTQALSQWLRVFPGLPGELNSGPSTHVSHLELHSHTCSLNSTLTSCSHMPRHKQENLHTYSVHTQREKEKDITNNKVFTNLTPEEINTCWKVSISPVDMCVTRPGLLLWHYGVFIGSWEALAWLMDWSRDGFKIWYHPGRS